MPPGTARAIPYRRDLAAGNPYGVPAGTYLVLNVDNQLGAGDANASMGITVAVPAGASGSQSFPVYAVAIDNEPAGDVVGAGEIAGDNLAVRASEANLSIAVKPSFADSAALVDEDGLTDGANPHLTLPQGLGDDVGGSGVSEAVYTGTLTGFTWNGTPGTIALSVDQAQLNTILLPSGLSPQLANVLFDGNNHLVIRDAGNNPVVDITITNNGVYTVTLLQEIRHDSAGAENNDSFAVTVTASNAAGSVAHNLTINIDDDVPVAGAHSSVFGLGVDESLLGSGGGASISSFFDTVDFGADGPALANSLVYSLTNSSGTMIVDGTPSGLVDTATGLAVLLYNDGAGGIVGKTDAAGPSVFTVAVSGDSVYFNQQRPIVHADGTNPNDLKVILVDTLYVKQTATDADGDTVSVVAPTPISLWIYDDGPRINLSGTTASLTVDESNFYGSPDSKDVSGLFAGINFGADGAAVSNSLTYSLTNSSGLPVVDGTNTGLTDLLGSPIHLFTQLDGSIQGKVVGGANNGVIVFNVTLSGSTVTLQQVWPIKHPNTGNPDDAVSALGNLIHVTATVTDKDGDTAKATTATGLSLTFEDDGPSISLSGSTQSLTVDESVLATDATQSYAGLFTANGGTDGTASVAYALGVKSAGVDSGLVDVATGQSVLLSMNGSTVEGKTAGGLVVFTVTVDGAGNVTLNQIRAVTHPDTSNHDDSKTLTAADLVTLTTTITDKDGDTSSVAANIGTTLNFEDDGPTISLSGTENILTVDESNLANNATLGFASAFTGDFKADGAGTVTYALAVTPGASGIVDVATGEAVNLVLNGTTVEGRTATTNQLVFTVTVAANGDVTLDQVRAVVHPTTDPDEPTTLTADDLVRLTATITDKDGDSASSTLNIGKNLVFKDDGPTISLSGTENILTVDETILTTNATQGFASAFTGDFKADGAGTVTYALAVTAGPSGLVDVATGEAVQLFMNGTTVEGRISGNIVVFTVTVAANGDVTLDQVRAVVHPTNDPDEPTSLSADSLVRLTATITDKDGDTASSTLNIGKNLVFKDDGPTISLSGTENILTVDETILTTNATQGFASAFTGDFKADGAGTVTYALAVTAGPSGLVDVATGEAVQLFMNGSTVEGRISGNVVVFTVTVAANGDVTLEQVRAVVHPTNDPDEPTSLTADSLVRLTATITDKDGDSASSTLNIGKNLVFKDDGPTISLSGTENILTVDETILTTNATQGFASAFTGDFKADGAGTVTYALAVTAGPSGLVDVATGEAVQLFMNGTTVEGRISGNIVVFTVSVAANGDVTLDQVRAVVHGNTSNHDEPVSLSADSLARLTATITDKDGDTASSTLNIGQNLVFEDDGPTAVNDGTKVISALNANATPELSFNVATGLLSNDTMGADGAAISKVTFGGNDYLPVGGVITINVTGGVLVVNTDGSWTFNQTAMQPTATTHNFTYTLKDGDNDVSTATFAVTLKSQPLPLFSNAVALVDEDGLAGGANPHLTIAQGNGDDVGGKNSASEAIYSDTLTGLNWQGDVGVLTLAVTQTQLNAITLPDGTHPQVGQVTGQNTGHLVINNASGQGVLDVTINPTTGAYTVTLLSPIKHTVSGSEDNVSLDITVKATNLGGVTEGTLTVTIDDDLPVANAVGEVTSGSAVLNTNLMLILDISGSMGRGSDLTGNGGSGALSKILAARAAVNELLEQYNSLGEVMVRIVTFSGSAGEQGAVWMTLAQAKTFVNALLDDGGSTNYDDALIDAMGAFPDSGRLGDGTGGTIEPANGAPIQNVSYFISDGQPNQQTNFPGVDYGGSGNSSGIQSPEETAWINFLKQYDIKSYAIGVDPSFASNPTWQDALKPIAYNGVTETNDDANLVITLSDFGALAQSLIGTIPTINASLLLNSNAFGGDGGFVKSLSFANGTVLSYNPTTNAITSSGVGVAYAWNSVSHVLTVTLAEGVMAMNMVTSVYVFTPDSSLGSVVTVPVGFVLSDSDGDTAANTLTLGVSPVDYAPIARDDSLIAANSYGSGFAVDDRWLLWNDSDADGDTLTIPGTITIDTNTAGSFTYTAEGGGQSDTGDVKYAETSGTTLNGNGLDNIIVGDGDNETLNGYEGKDVLVGAGGNDNLTGGEGNDLLMGGTGNDAYNFVGGLTGANATGQDLIVEEGGSADTVVLTGTTLAQVTLTQVGNNLKITYGSNADTITVEDQFSNPNKTIEFVTIGGVNYQVSGTSLLPMVAPNTNAGSGSGNEDAASIAVNLSGTDDGTVVSFRITSIPGNGILYKDAGLTQVIAANDLVTASGNAATVYFKPNANYNGTPTFQYASVDNLGLQDSTPATATITVNAVNDAPVATITPLTYSATEQTNLTIHGTGLSVGDANDGNAGSMTATLSVTAGILTAVAGNSGATVGGSGTATITITGTVTQINNLLGGIDTGPGSAGTIVYNANTDTPPASTTLTLQVNDGGNVGGGALTGSDTATINIAGVNDAPSIVQDYIITNETGVVTVQDAWLLRNDTDPENNTLTITAATTSDSLNFDVTPSHSGSAITFTLDTTNNGGGDTYMTNGEQTSLTYTLSDGSLTDNSPNATITYVTGNTLTGGANDEVIIGNSGATTINAGAGHDVLIGGGGTDTLNGEAGNDTLIWDSSDTFNGGADFDRVHVLTGGNTFAYDAVGAGLKYSGVEMVDLGDTNDRASSQNTVTINAADVLDSNVATIGGHQVDLFVIGDNVGAGAGDAATRDNVDLTGFAASPVATGVAYTDPLTGLSHTYDIYQGSGANTGIKIAIEQNLDVV
ncbi:MAG: VWA domain-containing protein [Rhodospirillaceae bacterium]|nr:VWA domain-containing protein [Rhodospirillaceae bacterium]